MKHIVFFVTLSLATAAWAQAEKPTAPAPGKPAAAAETAKPAAEKPAAKPVAEKPAAKPEAKPAVAAKKSRRQQDARHCLERATNDDIIKCAEAFL